MTVAAINIGPTTPQAVHAAGLRDGEGEARAIEHLPVRLANLRHIRAAYGVDVALQASLAARALAEKLVIGAGVVEGHDELLDIRLDRAPAGEGALSGEAICDILTLTPFETSAGKVHVLATAEKQGHAVAILPRTGDEGGWAEQYRADMTRVCDVLAQLSAAGGAIGASAALCMVWQPVRGSDPLQPCMFHEASLRLVDRGGAERSPAGHIAALERLGFVQLLDHFNLAAVASELEADAHVHLAVRISALSARWDARWEALLARLARTPGAAERLIVEITETAPFESVADATAFASRLRGRGCRVALDGFGTGFASIRTLLALAPDIVKIDHFFLPGTGDHDAEPSLLPCIIDMAKSMGAIVIVEGVETHAQYQLSNAAGAQGQQGNFWGAASSMRPWRLRQ